MSGAAHLNDRALLSRLVHLCGAALQSPFMPSPSLSAALDEIAGDLVAARRCPSNAAFVGPFESILFAAVKVLADGGAATTEELYRCAAIGAQALPIVQRHFGDAVIADIERAQAARAAQ